MSVTFAQTPLANVHITALVPVMREDIVVDADEALNTLAPDVSTDQVPVPGLCISAARLAETAQTV